MSNLTSELGLAMAVDTDDTANYLTQTSGLAGSLNIIDGLFNASSGHGHVGAHQGGALGAGSVGTTQLQNGAVTSAKLDPTVLAQALPSGSVFPFAGSGAPTGFLLCDGSAVSRTSYATLFTAIGTVYGVGDGSTTFNLPDLRGRVPIGAGTGSGLTNRALGANGGEENHTLSGAETGAHNHGVSDPTHSHAQSAHNHGVTDPQHSHALTGQYNVLGSGTAFHSNVGVSQVATSGGSTTGISINNATPPAVTAAATGLSTTNSPAASGHNNMQPFLGLNFIIKT